MSYYVGVVDEGGEGYGIWFPDIPGCTSGAATMDELYTMAIEAVALWVEETLDNGQSAPTPRGLVDILADPDVEEARRLCNGAITFLQIPLLLEDRRPAKANISIDAGVLRAIDAAATQVGLTRSGFIASAAMEKIRRQPFHRKESEAASTPREGAPSPRKRKSRMSV